jgi:hypothetical protein
MRCFVDIDIHQEPVAAAAILHWLAEGHASARDLNEGVLIPWGILGIALVATEATRQLLPSRKQSFAGWIRSEGARYWRGNSKPTVLAWKDTFWKALAHGQARRILDVKEGRVLAIGRVTAPAAKSHAGLIRRSARALGGTIGGEQDDLRIASALGMEFVL